MTERASPPGERVLLLSTSLARGGAENQVVQLAVSLKQRGWSVSVVSLATPVAFHSELQEGGIPLDSPHMRPGHLNLAALWRLLKILRRTRPAVLHAHLFHANILARLWRFLTPATVVISTIHSIAESGRGTNKVQGRDWLYRVTDRLAHRTVCVSAAVASRYADTGAVAPGRLRVIPNGVAIQSFRQDSGERARLRAELGLGDTFVWLAAGRLMWKKDYPTMLAAMARQRNGILLIAGTGPLENELKQMASDSDADIRFLGLREDIPQLMNACDALVLSSVVEGLPMVLIEAAASGLPAVATDAGGVREIVRDGETGFVVPQADPEALARAMNRLATMPAAERAALGEAARAHARAHYDLAAVACRWEQLYEECLQGAASGGAG